MTRETSITSTEVAAKTVVAPETASFGALSRRAAMMGLLATGAAGLLPSGYAQDKMAPSAGASFDPNNAGAEKAQVGFPVEGRDLSVKADQVKLASKVLGQFSAHGFTWGIYVSEDFRKLHPINEKVLAQDLASTNLYITPCQAYDIDILQKSLERSEKVATINGKDYFRMTLAPKLIRDDIVREAVSEIKRQFGADVPVEKFKITPISFATLEMFLDGRKFQLGTWPRVELPGSKFRPATIDLSPEFDIVAPKAVLQEIIDKADIRMNFCLPGVSIKMNTVDAVLRNFAKLKFGEFLTGDAELSQITEYEQRLKNSAGGLGGIVAQGSAESRGSQRSSHSAVVSREQVRTVAQSLMRVLRVNEWVEFEGPGSREQLNAFQSAVITRLLDRMYAFEVEVSKEGIKILDERVRKDITASELTQVTALAKAESDATGSSKASYEGASAESAVGHKTAQEQQSGTQGKIIAPKRIKLFRVNNSSVFDEYANLSWSSQKPQDVELYLSQDSEFGREVTVKPVVDPAHPIDFAINVESVPHVEGKGDEDICSSQNPPLFFEQLGGPYGYPARAGGAMGLNLKIHRVVLERGKIAFYYTYWVQELDPNDGTQLVASGKAYAELAGSGRILSVAKYKPYEWQSGQRFGHGWFPFTGALEIAGGKKSQTCSFTASAKGDGDGRDDKGNAQLRLSGRILAEVELKPGSRYWVRERSFKIGNTQIDPALGLKVDLPSSLRTLAAKLHEVPPSAERAVQASGEAATQRTLRIGKLPPR